MADSHEPQEQLPSAALVAASLPDDWYELVIAPGVDPSLPGIYIWSIEDGGTYVGKYTHGSRPLHEYKRNVLKLINDRPYRPQKPDGFRRIHRALAAAHQSGKKITLLIAENCDPADLKRREQQLIEECGTLNGGR